MSPESKKYIESISKATKDIRIADHMIYVTFPVIKDKRLLLKSLDQIYDALVSIINAILQNDYLNKRITLSSEASANFEIFIEKCSKRYNITSEEISSIVNLFKIVENHRKSPLEFSRKEKIVILGESSKTMIIDSEMLKKFLYLAKILLEKAKFGMSFQ